MHPAALPTRAQEDLVDGPAKSLVGVGGDESNADKATAKKPGEKPFPERIVLASALSVKTGQVHWHDFRSWRMLRPMKGATGEIQVHDFGDGCSLCAPGRNQRRPLGLRDGDPFYHRRAQSGIQHNGVDGRFHGSVFRGDMGGESGGAGGIGADPVTIVETIQSQATGDEIPLEQSKFGPQTEKAEQLLDITGGRARLTVHTSDQMVRTTVARGKEQMSTIANR